MYRDRISFSDLLYHCFFYRKKSTIMTNEPDIEIGMVPIISKTRGKGIEGNSSKPNHHDDEKKCNWIVHVFAVLISSFLTAGVGYAAFSGQHNQQMVMFQTQLDR